MYLRFHKWLSDSWLRWIDTHPRRAAVCGWVQCRLIDIEAWVYGPGELKIVLKQQAPESRPSEGVKE